MYDDMIALIRRETRRDEKGVEREYTASYHEVYCRVKSISRQEFFQAGEAGLTPTFLFEIHPRDYEGEDTATYRGETYSIYRTYEKSADVMELYVQREAGNHANYDV